MAKYVPRAFANGRSGHMFAPSDGMRGVTMAKVEIYTSPFCGYCFRAKRLLEGKGVAFEEIDVFMNGGLKRAMVERAGGRTSVPQIFIDDCHVGGSDELHALEADGKLDPLLEAQDAGDG